MRKAAGWVAVAALLGLGVWGLFQRDWSVAAAAAEIKAVDWRRADADVLVTVYKDPRCGCCAEWADHLREKGFRVEIEQKPPVPVARARLGIPGELLSCHAASVDGYALEGHVPADVIRRLLEERPAVAGLAVPRMPEGVPGMPPARPDRPPYDVIAFGGDGETWVYATR